MSYIHRAIESVIQRVLSRQKSILFLGPRQTGKSTLLSRLSSDLTISFVRPDVRQRYEKNPSLLIGEVEALSRNSKKNPLVVLDEIQKVPVLLDVIQDLIDRKIARFVLTGSSARKLKRGHSVNLLPGRVVALRCDPFLYEEKKDLTLKQILLYGTLPGICLSRQFKNQEEDLASYSIIYLEEEIRSEAIVRNLASFARFLELAAAESGKIINYHKLSSDIGVAHTTISAYYQILEDCLIIERIEPLTTSPTRRKLIKSSKALFFDLGVRRICAREGTHLPKELMGQLLEQWVGLELIRLTRLNSIGSWRVKFWRDPDGPEVDWILENEGIYIPIEVKWSDSPKTKDIRHLQTFIKEYPQTEKGYVICRCPRPIQLDKKIMALPWNQIASVLSHLKLTAGIQKGKKTDGVAFLNGLRREWE